MVSNYTRRRAIQALSSIVVAGVAVSPASATESGDNANSDGDGQKVYIVPKGEGFRSEVDDAEVIDGVTVERRETEFVVKVKKSEVPSKDPRSDDTVRRQQRKAEEIVEAQRKEWASEAL